MRWPPDAATPADPADDAACSAICEIGPWTIQCLALNGRGDLDSLPAGDLAYLKLVGRLGGMGRRATIAEVQEFYAPYEPYRGIAGRSPWPASARRSRNARRSATTRRTRSTRLPDRCGSDRSGVSDRQRLGQGEHSHLRVRRLLAE